MNSLDTPATAASKDFNAMDIAGNDGGDDLMSVAHTWCQLQRNRFRREKSDFGKSTKARKQAQRFASLPATSPAPPAPPPPLLLLPAQCSS
jgi:hypothetical protein